MKPFNKNKIIPSDQQFKSRKAEDPVIDFEKNTYLRK